MIAFGSKWTDRPPKPARDDGTTQGGLALGAVASSAKRAMPGKTQILMQGMK